MPAEAFAVLDRQPRVSLGHWPTPLEPAARLQATLGGPAVWIKRDDCTGLAVGGNKTRKLEFLLGRAEADGCDRIITFGALQSNHARQTAAACAARGLGCDLVLTRAVARTGTDYEASGNRLLDGILGARVHVVASEDDAFVRFAEIYDGAVALGHGVLVIPPGGSDATGTLGYVDGGRELAVQLAAAGLGPVRVVVAASTAGTAAGLALGLGLSGAEASVEAVCVYHDAAATAADIDRLVREVAGALGAAASAAVPWGVVETQWGPGYGIPTDASQEALHVLARTEGVLLDPVYTAKAFAHVMAGPRAAGGVDPGVPVVFVHTGGSPGLFAYVNLFDR